MGIHRPAYVSVLLATQFCFLTALAMPAWGGSARGADRPLTFEERVEAQRAIEQVNNGHRLFARPLDEVMPRALIEDRVRAYLKKSAALPVIWQSPIGSEALDEEVRRLVAGTRMPERLAEVFAALGNDPRLIRECLARPLLADRLARRMFTARPPSGGGQSWESFWSKVEPGLPEEPADAEVAGSSPAVGLPSATGTCQPDDTWTPTALPQATIPGFQDGHVVWTGNEMLVFDSSFQPMTGGIYDPTTDSWSALPVPPMGGVPYYGSKEVWTGAEVIFWGGYNSGSMSQPATYLRYNPFAGTWGTIPSDSPYDGLFDHTAIWTGTEIIVWGGNTYNYNPDGTTYKVTVTTLATGVRYNPRTNARSSFGPLGQSPRAGHTATWTGNAMLIFGGYQAERNPINYDDWVEISLAGGAAFDPAAGSFLPLESLGQPSTRHRHGAIWTGNSMIVWGGQYTYHDPAGPLGYSTILLGDGGVHDPQADTWSAIPVSAGSPSPRDHHAAVWTGSEMIIWNGPPDRARYDPAVAAWSPVSSVGAPCPATPTSAFWTGHSMLAWGCSDGSGGQYALHQADDRDLDGFSYCQGDCDDSRQAVHPGAVEVCDLRDDDCDGTQLADEVDADGDGFPVCGGDCRDDRWDIHPGAPEACDGLDDDCDGGLPSGEADADQDDYLACDLDCDDSDPDIRPGVQEICDGRDNDCSGASDEGFPNSDQDPRADCVDCRPADPSTWAVPPEVTNVQAVLQDGGQFFLWDDLFPASGIVVYDAFFGSLEALRQGAGDFSTGSCLYPDLIDYACDITGTAPAVGDGFYFVVRGHNTCGTGTYGSALADQTAGASPLTCP